MTFYFLGLFGLYFVLLLVLRTGWSRAFSVNAGKPVRRNILISVIIPLRDEGAHVAAVLRSLADQNYPPADFEVIMVDDHSSDGAVEKCSGLLPNLRVFALGDKEMGKKAALTRGIHFAKGEVVATTDADCVLPRGWLTTINAVFHDEGVKMAAGLVSMGDHQKFFPRWQAMEFASVMGTAIGALGLNKPLMCNGANLAFRRETFLEVGGYTGNEQIPSGDDEFLMRKIAQRFPGSIRVANSIAITQPQQSLKDFLYQRIRWAGKWRYNPSIGARLFAVFIFLVQASWIYFLLAPAVIDNMELRVALALGALKIVADLLFLIPVFRDLKIRFRILPFLGLQFLYPFYVIFIGLFAPWSGYQWKGRKI